MNVLADMMDTSCINLSVYRHAQLDTSVMNPLANERVAQQVVRPVKALQYVPNALWEPSHMSKAVIIPVLMDSMLILLLGHASLVMKAVRNDMEKPSQSVQPVMLC